MKRPEFTGLPCRLWPIAQNVYSGTAHISATNIRHEGARAGYIWTPTVENYLRS